MLREIRVLSRLGPLNYLVTSGSDMGMFSGYVWEQDGRVVGNVTVSRPTGHAHRWQISNVAVLDKYRGQGIGRRLMEAALDHVTRRGGRTAYLYVRDDNPSAMHLYLGLGFAEVDRSTELKLVLSPGRRSGNGLQLLEPLQPSQGHALFELVRRAEGPGRRWLYGIRRTRYVQAPDERLFQWFGSFLTGESESRWGFLEDGELHAALIVKSTRLWNRQPHRLHLWIHPNWRGRIEDSMAQDIVSLLGRRAPRPAHVSLPACEERAVDALLDAGFERVRTLIMVRREI